MLTLGAPTFTVTGDPVGVMPLRLKLTPGIVCVAPALLLVFGVPETSAPLIVFEVDCPWLPLIEYSASSPSVSLVWVRMPLAPWTLM